MEPADALNVARVAALMAGIPDHATAVTINRVCTSSMEAVISGMAMIQSGMADIILAGGTEHMSSIPYSIPGARWGCRLQDETLVDMLIRALHCGSHLIPHPEDGPVKEGMPLELFKGPVKEGMPLELFKGKPYIMGHTAEFVAQLHNISREEMDEIALRSHNNTERPHWRVISRKRSFPLKFPRKGESLQPSLTKTSILGLV
jgi:acetyl-CoA C-acetyltransferase